MKFFYFFLMLSSCSLLHAQQSDTAKQTNLESITVRAFEQSRKLKDAAAAINFIDKHRLDVFGSASIIQAVNSTAGVKMEERSPGSYRLNIRGSALRSPFGVRNVKLYYNDIPFTDPGGNTYLNALGYYNFNSIEIIKGPGSSLYGAGTGGVLLVEGIDANEHSGLSTELTYGSYDLKNIYGSVTAATKESKNKIGFQHQYSNGYRNHTASERNIFSWNGRFISSEKNVLKTTFLYSHLFYETPGALTKSEYDLNPKLARPAGGGFPGAEQNKASITQKTFLAGVSYSHQFSNAFSNTSVAYGMFTHFQNPTIRNYSKNEEPHTGGRTSFSYEKLFSNSSLHLIAGGELQQNFTSITVYKNKQGVADTLQTLDDISTRQSLAFIQATYEINGWELTSSGSLNFLHLSFRRAAPVPLPLQERSFSDEFAPRISLLKKWKRVTIYSSAARGFSPPTTAELSPSGSAINLSLNAEQGVNYELGFRGIIKSFSFDVNAFLFHLQNTIVQRRDAGGGDFFVNAGKTRQHGIETSMNYPILSKLPFVSQSLFWLSHTWHHFKYAEFKQINADFSGNHLPGTAPHTVSTGIEMLTRKGLSGNINFYYSGRIPLNDANSEFANAYHVLNAKIGYERLIKNKFRVKFATGIENLLDAKYSLGNDLNAAGGRYYNAASGRNYYLSLLVVVTKN